MKTTYLQSQVNEEICQLFYADFQTDSLTFPKEYPLTCSAYFAGLIERAIVNVQVQELKTLLSRMDTLPAWQDRAQQILDLHLSYSHMIHTLLMSSDWFGEMSSAAHHADSSQD